MQDKPIPKTITTKIIIALENGAVPWRRPWSSNRNEGPPTSFLRQWRFTGINHLLMNIQSDALGFKSRWWATERQWFNLGGKVCKKPERIPSASWGQAVRPHGNYYYNIDQVAGGRLNEYRFVFKHKPLEPNFNVLRELIEATGVRIYFGANRTTYYTSPKDYIVCPNQDRFERMSEFLTSILHEIGHWAMYHMGMDRGYAANELIVQLMACYLGADLGFPVEEDLENHVAYLDMWLKEMKADPSYIMHASKDARRISNRLLRMWKQARRRVA